MGKVVRAGGLLVACAAVLVAIDSCGYLSTYPAQIKGRVVVSDLPDGQWGGTRVVLTGKETTYTDSHGNYLFEGHINGADGYELTITRDGYDGWRVSGKFPYDNGQSRSTTVVVDVEDVRLSPL